MSRKSLLEGTAVYVSSSLKLLEIIFQVGQPNIGGNQKFEKTRAKQSCLYKFNLKNGGFLKNG